MCFQQDKAKRNFANEKILLLKCKLNGRVIAGNGHVNWSLRSYELTTSDYFL